MKNKFFANFLLLAIAFCFASVAKTSAQTNFAETVVVDLPSGAGAVSFKPQMSGLESNAEAPAFSVVNLKQQVVSTEKGFDRVLLDETNRVLFGYSLRVKKSEPDAKFELSFEPLTEIAFEHLRDKFLAISGGKPAFRLLTLPPISSSQTIGDGETVALDLLVNRQIGVKITDRVRVSSSREQLEEFPVRDFTLKDVRLAALASQLKINDEIFPVGNDKRRYDGSLLWFYLPEKGFFVVSLEPRAGYDFRRVGVLNGNKISFRHGSDEFVWTSSEAFLPVEGAWRLWVLHVPNYVPPAVALSTGIKRNEDFEKSRIEKAAERMMEAVDKNNPLNPARKSSLNELSRIKNKTNHPNNTGRVAAGATVSLENLLPKN